MQIGGETGRSRRSLRTQLTAFAVAYKAVVLAFIRQRAFITLFFAGAISVLAMAPFHAWPLLFFTLPVLFWALDDIDQADTRADTRSWRKAAWRGWAFGFGYHLVGLHWIGFAFLVQAERFAVLMPFAILGLTASLGLFFAAAGAAYAWTQRYLPAGMPRLVALALVIMASEWLRGHILTGFPWNVLGYALTMPLPLMQWAGLFGIYVLTAITVIVLASPLIVMSSGNAPRRGLTIAATTVAPLGFATIYGVWVLAANPTELDETVRLRIVQPSFTQKQKFFRSMHGEIFNRHLALSTRASGQPPTHIIWPEAAIPFFARRSKAALAAIGRALPDDTRVIAGTFRINASPDVPNEKVGPYRVYNSAMTFGGDGTVKSFYDKIHLVPFGEYLPAQPLLRALGFENLTRTSGGLAIGKAPRQLMRINGLPPVEMLICYEASFPGELVQGGVRPGLLINLTNDAWFGDTTGPYQHFHQTRLRAVEQGVAMVRSANNGISAIVDPMGRILSSLGLNKVGVVDGALPVAKNTPYYARFGHLIEFAFVFVMLVYLGTKTSYRRR